MGNVLIGGSVTGRADNSGQVYSGGTIGNVLIGGSITGGAGFASGLVFSNGAMGNVRIGGDLIGGSITGADSLDGSGAVISDGRIASATIGGSLIAGVDASIGALTKSGAIIAGDDIGPIRIGGSILGNSTNPARIIARGKEVKPATGFDVAIASLTVRGDVRFAGILAGFDDDQNPANADASIGRVIVGRDWVASDLVAGAQDAGAAGFGAGDVLQAAGDTGLVARIAGITIWGTVTSSFPILDRFGFVAEQIDALRFGSTVFSLDPGPSNDDAAIPFTFGVRLLEVS
jgi:hypothetical protein